MTRPGLSLATYLAASRLIPLAAPRLLARRLAKGKELPDRWREKLGEPSLPKPDGPLIWLHAVGLGEVLALRGLIAAMAGQSDANFLVTSTTRGSAEVLARNLPPRTRHQFLPLDAPAYLARFLDHWRPDLSIWAEQDLWPGAVHAADTRGIPLALVNARMNVEAYARRRRWVGLYADLFARFRLITAQDNATGRHLQALGAVVVSVRTSLKAAAPPLAADPQALAQTREALVGQSPVLLASSHHEDEFVTLSAFRALRQRPLLIIAPRDPSRGPEIVERVAEHGMTATLRSAGQGPVADVWIVDTLGEMGLWYRLCPVTIIGGTFGPTEGHNPWEPAGLGSAILHGPRIANFAADFCALHQGAAARLVMPDSLAAALAEDHSGMASRAKAVSEAAQGSLDPLAGELLTLAGLA
ncbi:3-deoxy-D-manno-octulosonic acid transferase [Tabrizicola sp.]|uniref:3-deoxy-D-manno-octulosonic acid transferase n=1 Tax=Tabrizicola sp. TaxID=2005166 RepID=UPI002733300A|nr:glycosyltransferase N-terminal domain-containing protein [Tabrizicola sp.]MDP3194845.1 glycosyltransferase N-terminal domain-containing protein [Tabrizicola sp.]